MCCTVFSITNNEIQDLNDFVFSRFLFFICLFEYRLYDANEM